MTILPKKKHQEGKKSEQEQDSDGRRSRPWSSPRDRGVGRSNEDLDSSSAVFQPPSPVYNDLEQRDGEEYSRTRLRYASGLNSPPTTSVQDNPNDQASATEDGYNSSDEHVPKSNSSQSLDGNSYQHEVRFEKQLQDKKGYTVKKMAADGACLFRAVADQVYGDQEMHTVVRKHCMDYMMKNHDYFSQYVTEDFSEYIHRKRNEHTHGNQVEMQAMSEMYNRPIEVYQYSLEPMNTFTSRGSGSALAVADNPPIRVSYHGNVHYNSLVDPFAPTVGVGLGLAGYKTRPQQLASTLQESETQHLEQEMLADKIQATDWESTDEHIAELVARESYLQWMNDSQKKARPGTSSSTCTSSTISKRPSSSSIAAEPSVIPPTSSTHSATSLLMKAPGNSPTRRHSPPPASAAKPYEACLGAGASMKRASPRPLSSPVSSASTSSSDWQYDYGGVQQDPGFSEWSSDPLLAAVLAQSQKEYLETLSRASPQASSSNLTDQVAPSDSESPSISNDATTNDAPSPSSHAVEQHDQTPS